MVWARGPSSRGLWRPQREAAWHSYRVGGVQRHRASAGVGGPEHQEHSSGQARKRGVGTRSRVAASEPPRAIAEPDLAGIHIECDIDRGTVPEGASICRLDVAVELLAVEAEQAPSV